MNNENVKDDDPFHDPNGLFFSEREYKRMNSPRSVETKAHPEVAELKKDVYRILNQLRCHPPLWVTILRRYIRYLERRS